MSRMLDEKKQKFRINQLLDYLANDDITSEKNYMLVCEWILELYDDNVRLSYFFVSEYIIKNFYEDETLPDILITQFRLLMDSINESVKFDDAVKKQNIIKLSLKISDHIKLEKLRQDHFNSNNSRKLIDLYNKSSASIDKKSDELSLKFDNKTNELSTKIDKIDVSAVTILGVFTAITISVFGTLNIVGSLLTSLYMLSIPRALFSFGFGGFIIFNTIFLLLHTISKFTNTKLEKPAKKEKLSQEENTIEKEKPKQEETTKERLRFIRDLSNFRNLYPLVYYYNISMGITMLLSIFIWGLNRFYNFL